MQPQTSVKIDRRAFDRLKKSMQGIDRASRLKKIDPGYAADVPEEIDMQLIYRCNLRCVQCYQWNDLGIFKKLPEEKSSLELEIGVIEKILEATQAAHSRLFLWGGEPLLYSHWNELAALLERDLRWTVLCTNGLLIDVRIDALNRFSSHLALLISVDGLQESHDFLRGKGTFNRVIHQIKKLLSLQRNGVFKGLVSVNCVICDATVPYLFKYMEFFENLGVDSVYFNFPWYISPAVAGQMDDYFSLNLSWFPTLTAQASWHGYTHFLSPSLLDLLHTQTGLLTSRTWNVRIRFQPPLNEDEIDGFVAGKADAMAGKSECLAIRNRVEVLADGTVSACKFFPEFAVGNLNSQRPLDVWHGEKFKRFRGIIDGGLMPVCSKCVTLYLNGK